VTSPGPGVAVSCCEQEIDIAVTGRTAATVGMIGVSLELALSYSLHILASAALAS
jgi:hypothetical protein